MISSSNLRSLLRSWVHKSSGVLESCVCDLIRDQIESHHHKPDAHAGTSRELLVQFLYQFLLEVLLEVLLEFLIVAGPLVTGQVELRMAGLIAAYLCASAPR